MATVKITTASNDRTLGDFDDLLFESCLDKLPKNVYAECGITDVKEGSTSVLLTPRATAIVKYSYKKAR